MQPTKWIRYLSPALLFCGSLVLYLGTLAPTVTLVDSGELIVAARNLGVAHPPGFPLYVLLAHLATLVPAGNVALRVNALSAICAALAVAVLCLAVTEAVSPLRARAAARNRAPYSRWLMPLPGLVAGSLFALSRTLWSYATVAEVYTLNALLILLTFLLALRWRNATLNREDTAGRKERPPRGGGARKRAQSAADASIRAEPPRESRLIYLAGFTFGLALGVHHVTVALTLPALVWLVVRTAGVRFIRSRRLPATALACLMGAAVYGVLPIAAARSPVPNWGNPNSVERFWAHVSGRQYQSYLSLSPDQMRKEASSFSRLAAREFGWSWMPAGLFLAIGGFFALYRKDPVLFSFLALLMGFTLLFAMTYEIAEDKDAYYLPMFMSMCMAAGFGIHGLLGAARTWTVRLAAAIALLAPAVAFTGNFGINNRRSFFVAEDYAGDITATIAPGGMLLTGDWQVASPMLYLQEIGHQRRDVICIDVQLLRRSWYFLSLESKYPALMLQARSSVQAFLEDLHRWEGDPQLYERDSSLNRRITARFHAMIEGLVRAHLPVAPVYATQDVVMTLQGEGQALSDFLRAAFQIVPQGLVFQLFADREVHRPALAPLRTRGLWDAPAAVREDEVVRQKILPVYVTMLVNAGRAFAVQGDGGQAMEAYRQAYRIDFSGILVGRLLPPEVLLQLQ